jgi:hypothetical protein
VLFTVVLLGAHLTQLVTAWQHVQVRSEPAITRPSPLLAAAMRGVQLLDYGWFLLLAAALLPWPAALFVYLILSSALHAAAAVMQLALNWRRELSDRATADGTSSTGTSRSASVSGPEPREG